MNARQIRYRRLATTTFRWPAKPLARDVRSQITMLMLTAEVLALDGNGAVAADAVAHALACGGYKAFAP